MTQVDSVTSNYVAYVDIREAFKTFKVELSIGSDIIEDTLPQTCTFSTINGPVYGSTSSASLV